MTIITILSLYCLQSPSILVGFSEQCSSLVGGLGPGLQNNSYDTSLDSILECSGCHQSSRPHTSYRHYTAFYIIDVRQTTEFI